MRTVRVIGPGGIAHWENVPEYDDLRKARAKGYAAGERSAFDRYRTEWATAQTHTTYDQALTRADQDIAGWREQREMNLGYYYPHTETA